MSPQPIRTSVRRPFLLVLLATGFCLAGLAIGLFLGSASVRDRASRSADRLEKTISLNHRLRTLIGRHVQLALSATTRERGPRWTELQDVHRETGRQINRYLELSQGGDERRAVETVRQLQAELAVRVQGLVRESGPANGGDDPAQLDQVFEISARIDALLQDLSALSSRRLHSILDPQRSLAFTALQIVVAALVIVVLGCGLLLVLLRIRVLTPLRAITQFTDRVADGDYTRRLTDFREDEIGHVARRIDYMAQRLAGVRDQLEEAVDARTEELETVHAQLLQSEKMSAVGRLVSGVAHELNNPLTAIMGLGDLARQSVGPNHEATPLLETLAEQTERCKHIVADLLGLARQRETQRKTIPLDETLAAATGLYRHSARTTEIAVNYRPSDAPCFVLGDHYKLQQVLLALLNNAGDAATGGGRIGRIDVTLRSGDDWIEIDVEDNGPGVAEPDRVFDPFYTTKPEGRGTGLGLTICYGIVEEHQGQLSVAQGELGGALFRVRLPAADAPLAAETTAGGSRPRGINSGRRVLLVDDEPQVLRIEAAFLERLGLESVKVDSGEAAIEVLKSTAFDIVLTDLRMPGAVNGVGLHRWIEQHVPALAESVLFVTGDMVNVGEDPALLPAPYLSKPFTYEQFSTAIDRLLPERRASA